MFTFIQAGHFQLPHVKRMLKCVVAHPNRWLRPGGTASNIYCFPSKFISLPPPQKNGDTHIGIVIGIVICRNWIEQVASLA